MRKNTAAWMVSFVLLIVLSTSPPARVWVQHTISTTVDKFEEVNKEPVSQRYPSLYKLIFGQKEEADSMDKKPPDYPLRI